MLSDLKNIADVLKLPPKVIAGVFLFCLALVGLYRIEAITWHPFGEATDDALLILAVLFGVMTLVNLAMWLCAPLTEKRRVSMLRERRAVRRAEYEEQRAAEEQKIVGRLDALSPDELRILTDCIRSNNQSFSGSLSGVAENNLRFKRLVCRVGGMAYEHAAPYTIPDFVWRALQERRDELIEQDDENRRKEEKARRASQRRRGY